MFIHLRVLVSNYTTFHQDSWSTLLYWPSSPPPPPPPLATFWTNIAFVFVSSEIWLISFFNWFCFAANYSYLDTIFACKLVDNNNILLLVFDICWKCSFYAVAASNRGSKHTRISPSSWFSSLTLVVLCYCSRLAVPPLFDWYVLVLATRSSK